MTYVDNRMFTIQTVAVFLKSIKNKLYIKKTVIHAAISINIGIKHFIFAYNWGKCLILAKSLNYTVNK